MSENKPTSSDSPFRPQSAQEQQDEELVTAFLAKQLASQGKTRGFDLENYKPGAKSLAVSPTQAWRKAGWQGYPQHDPIQAAADALEAQIKQWGEEMASQGLARRVETRPEAVDIRSTDSKKRHDS